ncbi:DinB family protein [Alloacidobacterium sp.]|uniref:DinB family protein n=1 Tax=Alloacidobacterium sp. TaxID=2951999 RepID=UPI002D317B35|nr:DinB family protein [Alloacidobacterium sp.]HYK37963.1 DinB family protein [Alloacidobacterium sp.]
MRYPYTAIPNSAIPQAANPLYQHLLDTYVSETNKVVSTWRIFSDTDLDYKPHRKSTDVRDILKHQLLSERRFFGEFLGTPEPPPKEVLPDALTIETASTRLVELVLNRLSFFAQQDTAWWMETVPFFDVQRQRIWVFWRRILHTAHHRTQLTVYLRLLGKEIPSTYGPTADNTWQGADPTNSVEAAGRQ